MDFQVYTTETAPAASRDTLAMIEKNYGFLPNLAGAFAESPPVLSALLGLLGGFDNPAMSLTALERQVVLLTTSAANRCVYCASAHGMLAHNAGLSREEVARVQQGEALADPRLRALQHFTKRLVAARGWVSDAEVEAFIAAGFTKAQVLEVVLGVAVKTLTNYANHITKPPVNEQFAAFRPTFVKAAAE